MPHLPGTTARRLLVATTAVAFVALAGTAVATAGTSTRTIDQTAASSNSRWLASKLRDGQLPNPLNPTLPDHGLMIDTVLAMYASQDSELAQSIITFLDDGKHARDYFTWYGYGQGWAKHDGLNDRVAGATAKTLVAAEVAGRNPRSFGGYDLVKEVQDTIVRAADVAPGGRFAEGNTTMVDGYYLRSAEVGRVVDYGPNTNLNNANTFGQALAVIGLAGVKENDDTAIEKLTWQQCEAGYFRIFYSYDPTTYQVQSCDDGLARKQSAPDRDATGMGLSAMMAAQRAGAKGLQPRIDKAVTWLASEQQANGGWGGGVTTDAPNTNSTGLVVQALADAGGPAPVIERGAAYLRSAQVIDADASTSLSKDIGAIAYTPQEYAKAKTGGIGGLDTWIRASAQASLGLSRQSFWSLVTGQTSWNKPTPTTPGSGTSTPTVTVTSPVPGPSVTVPGPTVTVTQPAAAPGAPSSSDEKLPPPLPHNDTETIQRVQPPVLAP